MFNDPEIFLDLIEGLVINPFTVIQRKYYLEKIHEKAQKMGNGFNIKNTIFNIEVISVV